MLKSQSPKSGQLHSNTAKNTQRIVGGLSQSPKSGQLHSNAKQGKVQYSRPGGSQSPKSGQLHSNKIMANLKRRYNDHKVSIP